MTLLYIKDNKGAIRIWEIETLPDGFEISHGVEGGSMQTKFEEVSKGKSNRTVEEQIELQVQSRINKQIDKGYSFSREDALKKPTNALGLLKPMLAHKYRDIAVDFKKGVFVQRKYDGNRCIIHNNYGELIAYSRNGKIISTINHILSTIKLPEGASIDGELYCHGKSLQQIVSLVKRQQADCILLKFHAYDYISDLSFEERFDILKSVKGAIEIVPTFKVNTEKSMVDYHIQFREEKYEGTILRLPGTGYEDGKRSRSLLKVKDFNDEEFQVINITPSKDGWAILTCMTSEGKSFNVSAPGTMSEKQEVLRYKELYIGKRVTVEYAYITEDRIPFHPIAKVWR